MIMLHFNLGAFATFIYPKTALNTFSSISNSLTLLVIDTLIILIVLLFLNKFNVLKKKNLERQNQLIFS